MRSVVLVARAVRAVPAAGVARHVARSKSVVAADAAASNTAPAKERVDTSQAVSQYEFLRDQEVRLTDALNQALASAAGSHKQTLAAATESYKQAVDEAFSKLLADMTRTMVGIAVSVVGTSFACMNSNQQASQPQAPIAYQIVAPPPAAAELQQPRRRWSWQSAP